jgi:hypothetical protein
VDAFDQPSATDLDHGSAVRITAAPPTLNRAASPTSIRAAPAAGDTTGGSATQASGPATDAPRGMWPWLGRWQSVSGSPLPGFRLEIDDAGAAGDQERIVATEPSGRCPARYSGTTGVPLGGPLVSYPMDTSVRLTLDATLPAGADPKGCTLLPDPAFYAGAGGDRTSPAAIQFQVIGAVNDLALVSVTVHPGQTIAIRMTRG